MCVGFSGLELTLLFSIGKTTLNTQLTISCKSRKCQHLEVLLNDVKAYYFNLYSYLYLPEIDSSMYHCQNAASIV